MVSCDVGQVRVVLQELNLTQAASMGDVRSSMRYAVFALLFEDYVIFVDQILVDIFEHTFEVLFRLLVSRCLWNLFLGSRGVFFTFEF